MSGTTPGWSFSWATVTDVRSWLSVSIWARFSVVAASFISHGQYSSMKRRRESSPK